ncbi:type II toxin-antitoxin system RelB family antitoxin [Rhizobium laguerreae]|uniref:type II toxin-antitoxin system RelB family antitoxin n=1 Tax=Rhizobium laguerreae TaxID=1076926 RepID=UPI0037049062
MATTKMMHVRVEETLKDDACRVLAQFGLTTSEAVRIFLTAVVKERGMPAGLTQDKASHDAWFRASVREALEDERPRIPHDEVMASVRATLASKASVGFDVA